MVPTGTVPIFPTRADGNTETGRARTCAPTSGDGPLPCTVAAPVPYQSLRRTIDTQGEGRCTYRPIVFPGEWNREAAVAHLGDTPPNHDNHE